MEKITPTLFSWASILDQQTRQQAIKTAGMPFIYPHLALMPDAHLGKGATVGSVIPTIASIMPAAVGVDIGCGMIAVRTQWTADDMPVSLVGLRQDIERRIPLSPGVYNQTLRKGVFKRIERLEAMPGAKQATQVAGNWPYQLGSLGGGNHFIEVSLDEDDRVWAFLHSGSRGVGNKLAMKHIKVAQELCARQGIRLPDRDLAYLREDQPEFEDYIRDLRWAQDFALLNREEMMDRLLEALSDYHDEQVIEHERINCHHNYTSYEKHYGSWVWLSRKGAIDAHEGVMGLIPGSMGARSYVVRGLGNTMALNSSPHGAGRVHSRSSAKREFNMADLEARMEGIEWSHKDAFLDEHPDAYKDIDVVMADSHSLVETVHELRQIVNVKGE